MVVLINSCVESMHLRIRSPLAGSTSSSYFVVGVLDRAVGEDMRLECNGRVKLKVLRIQRK